MKQLKTLPKHLSPRDKNPKNKKDFKYIPKKNFKKSNKKVIKESPFNILKNLNFN